MSRYYQTFDVETAFLFPIDMFRYDYCFPHSEIDAHKIINNLNNPPQKMTVTVGRFVSSKAALPTIGRWNSFGCQISDIKTQ